MPCFSPENAVFITNKWDLVKKQIDSSDKDSSESDDEDENQIWEKLKKDITQEWPFVKMENIFKMNLKDVSMLDVTIVFTEYFAIFWGRAAGVFFFMIIHFFSFSKDFFYINNYFFRSKQKLFMRYDYTNADVRHNKE